MIDIQKQIDEYEWYHRIDLNGIVTPGYLPYFPAAYKIPDDLTGKRVLDIGAWDGYWTFEALKRGASEVVAIDDWSDLPHVNNKPMVPWATFDLAKSILGYTDEQCVRHTMSLYDINTLGKFDVVFFFGVLYHCRYPLLALDKIAEITDEVYIESAICNDYSPYNGGINNGYKKATDIVMEFYSGSQLGCIPTNWWSPTLSCLCEMMLSAGFKKTDLWKYHKPPELSQCRGFAKGKK